MGARLISVLVADDHTLFAEGVSQALAAIPDLHVAGTASGGVELVALAGKTPADVLLIDLEMPDLSGFEVLAAAEGIPPDHHRHDARRRQKAISGNQGGRTWFPFEVNPVARAGGGGQSRRSRREPDAPYDHSQ